MSSILSTLAVVVSVSLSRTPNRPLVHSLAAVLSGPITSRRCSWTHSQRTRPRKLRRTSDSSRVVGDSSHGRSFCRNTACDAAPSLLLCRRARAGARSCNLISLDQTASPVSTAHISLSRLLSVVLLKKFDLPGVLRSWVKRQFRARFWAAKRHFNQTLPMAYGESGGDRPLPPVARQLPPQARPAGPTRA